VVSENPVPSITLSITQDDVKRVLEASQAMREKLELLQCKEVETSEKEVDEEGKKSEEQPASNDITSAVPVRTVSSSDSSTCSTQEVRKAGDEAPATRPLHEMILEAAKQCDHPMFSAKIRSLQMRKSISPSQV